MMKSLIKICKMFESQVFYPGASMAAQRWWNNNRIIALMLVLIIANLNLQAQSELFSLLDNEEPAINYTEGTFRSVRLINGYTSETAGKNDLVFSISHRFGPVNGGAYELFGLDASTIRFGFEYGVNDRLSVGLGRSNFQKLYDGFIKVKLIRQSSGAKNIPFSLTLLEGMAIKTEKWVNPNRDYPFTARLYYTHELFIARKFNNKLSAQLVPVIIHRNMVDSAENQNLVPAIGIGGNYSVNHWLSVSAEYFYLLPENTADLFENSLSFGIDIESGGGHVFQIHVSNSQGMTEKQFIPETTGRWLDGDIRIGFNIIRVFSLNSKYK